ncbi:MAG: hypothetical protein OK474_10060 [Thaumarchaeota archaeon]|nr:hypothetical protein [Nitrososphaerota archaeon]
MLRELGLSHLEAVVYSTLVSLGPSPAREVSQASHLAREHCYEVLRRLENKGLVKVQLGDHSVYVPAEPRTAVSLFISDLDARYASLRDEAYEVGAWLETTKPSQVPESHNHSERRVQLVFGKHTLLEFERELNACKTEYLGIIAPETLETATGIRILESLARATKRGVAVRVLTGIVPARKELLRRLTSEFSIRTNAVAGRGPRFDVFDRSRVMQPMHGPTAEEGEMEAICSESPALVNGLVAYFEELWRKSRPLTKRKVVRAMVCV